MNQPIIQGALPILSSILGNDTVAGLMAVFNLALNTVTTTTAAAFNNYNGNGQNARHQGSSFKNQDYGDYRGEQAYYGQEGQDDNQGQKFQSAIMSTLALVFSTVNSAFSSVTASQTPLTTYILMALLSYIIFRIIYGLVSWVVRSVLNLIKVSIMITVVTTILWFVINVTSSPGGDTGDEYDSTGQQQNRHQDPISQVLRSLQSKFNAEFERQQQYLQNPHVY